MELSNLRWQSRCMCVLFGAVLTSMGLFACTWPWPSHSEDTTGLGKSEIARILKLYCCAPTQMVISREIRIELVKASKDRSPRSAAESIGFVCNDPPSQMCHYAGEMKYQVHGAPEENRDAEKVHIVTYSIVIPNYDDTNDIPVERKTEVVP